MKKLLQDKKLCILAAFAAVELIIFIVFEILRFTTGDDAIYLKYMGILLCLAIAGLNCAFYGNDAKVMLGGLFFTAISDLFILVLNVHYIFGVCTFIIVQLFYFARIYLITGAKPYFSLGVRVGLIIMLLIVLGVKGILNPLVGMCAVYFPLLVCNVVDSAFLIKKSKRYIFFFIGLFLFMCCDICVGLDNLTIMGILNIPEATRDIINILIWTFYLPSQTLIVLSTRDVEYKLFFKKKAENEE